MTGVQTCALPIWQDCVRLARARGGLRDTAAAVDAYARAVALAPDNTDLLRVYADALLAAGRSEEVPPMLEAGLPRLLAADSKDLVALWFFGVAAQKAGDRKSVVEGQGGSGPGDLGGRRNIKKNKTKHKQKHI